MSKSFDKAVAYTDKLYTWLENRDWRVPDSPFKDTQRKINELQREAVDCEIERLKRYLEEVRAVVNDEVTNRYGEKIKVSAADRRQARVEQERINKAIGDLRGYWIELVGEVGA